MTGINSTEDLAAMDARQRAYAANAKEYFVALLDDIIGKYVFDRWTNAKMQIESILFSNNVPFGFTVRWGETQTRTTMVFAELKLTVEEWS